MAVRVATERDIPRIAEIYDILTSDPETCKYTNWAKNVYPTKDFAVKALADSHLFVGEDDNGIFGSMLLNSIQLPEYKDIPWKYEAAHHEVLVIHTLCIDIKYKGKGKAREMIAFAEKHGRCNKMKVIRLDTYEGNLPACAMYPKLGYEYSGTAFFNFMGKIPEQLKCFEKLL